MSASFFSFPTAGAAARLHQCPQSLQRGTALVEGTGPLRGAVAAEAAAGCHGLLGRDGAVGGWMGLGLPDLVQFFSMNLFSRCCFFMAIPCNSMGLEDVGRPVLDSTCTKHYDYRRFRIWV